MEMQLLRDIAIIFAMAIVILLIFLRIHIPILVAFLVTGALAGPYGLGLVRATEDVELLAEIGVILLLFSIGLEFSLKSLLQIKKIVFLGGAIQVLLTLAAGFALARGLGRPVGGALFLGFLAALSSTAIVLRILQERGEVDTPHGRATLGILIFQDIAVVPMMLLTPLLAGSSETILRPLLLLSAKGILIILVVMIGARWVVPQLLRLVSRARSAELFLLTVLLILLSVEWGAVNLRLSLALGAFFAGLLISESAFSIQALGSVLPIRNAFIGLFFVSIGMLLDVRFLLEHLGWVLLLTAGVLAVKSLLAAFAGLALGFPLRSSVLVGLALCQVGEFSFVLARTGLQHQLLTGEIYQWFLAVSILTMAATPLMMALAPRMAQWLAPLPLPKALQPSVAPLLKEEERFSALSDHLIIVGYGINGRNLSHAALFGNIPYVVIEMNPDTVQRESEEGTPIFYGDATQDAVLEHAGIVNARVLVIAISDTSATRHVAEAARRLNPGVHIIARTRFVQQVGALQELGANEVVPEEFETSIEIFTRVLAKYLVPLEDIERFVVEVRAGSYEMLRSPSQPAAAFADVAPHLADVEVNTLRVALGAYLAGRSLVEADLRAKYGVTVLAIRRGGETLAVPSAETLLQSGDEVIVLGTGKNIAEVRALFAAS